MKIYCNTYSTITRTSLAQASPTFPFHVFVGLFTRLKCNFFHFFARICCLSAIHQSVIYFYVSMYTIPLGIVYLVICMYVVIPSDHRNAVFLE